MFLSIIYKSMFYCLFFRSARNSIFTFFTACSPRGFALAHFPIPELRVATLPLPGVIHIAFLRNAPLSMNNVS